MLPKLVPGTDPRDAAFEEVLSYASENSDLVVLTNDMGAQGLDKLKEVVPQRVFNVGIAEQNLFTIASGMALSGFKVVVFGISAHLFGRGYEQFRNDIALTNLPVVTIAVGAGLSYGSDGPTHHGLHDISLLKTLPNVAIYCPSSSSCIKKSTSEALKADRPSVIRIDKETVPEVEGKPLHSLGLNRFFGSESAETICISVGSKFTDAFKFASCIESELGIEVGVLDISEYTGIAVQELLPIFQYANEVVIFQEETDKSIYLLILEVNHILGRNLRIIGRPPEPGVLFGVTTRSTYNLDFLETLSKFKIEKASLLVNRE